MYEDIKSKQHKVAVSCFHGKHNFEKCKSVAVQRTLYLRSVTITMISGISCYIHNCYAFHNLVKPRPVAYLNMLSYLNKYLKVPYRLHLQVTAH